MVAFADLGDVEARLREPLDEVATERAETLLEDVSDAIRAAAGGQTIYPSVSETISIVGAGRKTVRLPQVPVTAVSAVTVTTVSGTTTVPTLGYGWDADGRLEAIRGAGGRGCWEGTVNVTYTHGFASPPDELARLNARLVVCEVDQRSGIKSESDSVGDKSISVTYETPTAALNDADRRIAEKYAAALLP